MWRRLQRRVRRHGGRLLHGRVPLPLIFDEPRDAAPGRAIVDAVGEDHSHLFEAWSFRSAREWSFNALQRAMEHLPDGIYRAKGLVRLDLPTGDYGVLQLTGRRAWLRLCEPDGPAEGPSVTELVFIGQRGATSNEAIAAHFEDAHAEAADPAAPPQIVTDLRAFSVVFT